VDCPQTWTTASNLEHLLERRDGPGGVGALGSPMEARANTWSVPAISNRCQSSVCGQGAAITPTCGGPNRGCSPIPNVTFDSADERACRRMIEP
jgi:hypothetical protein